MNSHSVKFARTGPFVRCRSRSRAGSGRTLDKIGKTDNGNLNGVRVRPLCSGDQLCGEIRWSDQYTSVTAVIMAGST